MSIETEAYNRNQSISSANSTSHYVLIAIAVAIGFFGVILRFIGNWEYIDLAADIILIIGIILALKAVFAILK